MSEAKKLQPENQTKEKICSLCGWPHTGQSDERHEIIHCWRGIVMNYHSSVHLLKRLGRIFLSNPRSLSTSACRLFFYGRSNDALASQSKQGCVDSSKEPILVNGKSKAIIKLCFVLFLFGISVFVLKFEIKRESTPEVKPSRQIVGYLIDPNSEKVVPENTSKSALAYATNGGGAVFYWNTKAKRWE